MSGGGPPASWGDLIVWLIVVKLALVLVVLPLACASGG